MSAPTILSQYEGRDTNYWRVSNGPGKPAVTVRYGQSGVYACLTDYSTSCIHVEAVRASVRPPSEVAS